ncbi:MAG TPA: cyclic nucleotide-binding domain-containing protein, partial [Oscillospiraceae bacterium]|nr:cyclic nucleotide-binding domain-containing protein [Oscillospiraceae bacterium]
MKKHFKTLETIALFDGIDKDNFETLLHCLEARIVNYNKDDIIFMVDEKIDNPGIVLSGRVQIVQEDYFGNKCIIDNVETGQLFGVSFSFAGIKSTPFSIYAVEKSNVLFINSRAIITTCKKSCDFHHRLIFN